MKGRYRDASEGYQKDIKREADKGAQGTEEVTTDEILLHCSSCNL